MAKLPKFTLTHNEKKDRWDLTKDGASRPTTTFATKAEATKVARSRRLSARPADR
ncbi:DUF2188 domain-containing protein [Ensifer aridi]|uniref:DUF2188 domain-containing protein n=1 Tax=Ensifer aridi TaxID=1708715 RepID=UPI001AECD452|nr:DUF2188 domain-containing protein [Ensifer aridi]